MRSTLKLVAIPVAISTLVTCLRLTGELLHWSERWFSTATGGDIPQGWSWLVGITWLPILFGPYFASRLWRAGGPPIGPWRALGLALVGVVVGMLGPRLVFLLVPPRFPAFLLVVWACMAVAGLLQVLAWPALFRALLAYGLLSRALVAVVMFLAMRGAWGTHYDYVDMPAQFQLAFWPRYLALAFVPQLVFWVAFTIVLGSLCGSLAALALARTGARGSIAPAGQS